MALEKEIIDRMREWREKFEERLDEIKEGKMSWRSSAVCFPSLSEGKLRGGGGSIVVQDEGELWLSSDLHSSSCPYGRVP